MSSDDRRHGRRERLCLCGERRARHKTHLSLSEALPEPFIIDVEECTVLDDWPGQVSAELVQQERIWRCAVERRASIQGVVAEIIEYAAVKRVRSRVGRYRNLAARCHAGIGVEILRLHLELRNRVERYRQADIFLLRPIEDAGCIDAIEQ